MGWSVCLKWKRLNLRHGTPWCGGASKLPAKLSQLTAEQASKAYSCVGQACRALNTAAVLQVFAGESMRVALVNREAPGLLPYWRKVLNLSLQAPKSLIAERASGLCAEPVPLLPLHPQLQANLWNQFHRKVCR